MLEIKVARPPNPIGKLRDLAPQKGDWFYSVKGDDLVLAISSERGIYFTTRPNTTSGGEFDFRAFLDDYRKADRVTIEVE